MNTVKIQAIIEDLTSKYMELIHIDEYEQAKLCREEIAYWEDMLPNIVSERAQIGMETNSGMVKKIKKGKLTDPITSDQVEYIKDLNFQGYILDHEMPRDFKKVSKATARDLISKAKERRGDSNLLKTNKRTGKCVVTDCGRDIKSKGYCSKHYQIQRNAKLKLKSKGGEIK